MKSPLETPRVAYLRALASPARLEVVEGLQLGGASSVAELGRRLGRAPDSLYHHLRELEGAGVIERCGTATGRKKGGRRGVLFRMRGGRPIAVGDESMTDDERLAMGAMAGALLRLTERDLDQALTGPEAARPGAGFEELPIVQRSKAWLSPGDVPQLLTLLEAVEDFLRARAEPDATPRSLFSLTYALTTLTPKGATRPPARPAPREDPS